MGWTTELRQKYGLIAQSVEITFRLPPETIVVDQWHQIETMTQGCQVTLGSNSLKLWIKIDPGLLIDVTWPFGSDVLWSGMIYTFANKKHGLNTGRITTVFARTTQAFAPGWTDAAVAEEIVKAVDELLRGTRYVKPGYHPDNDPEPGKGLEELRRNFVGSPNRSKIEYDKILGIGATAVFWSKDSIRKEAGDFAVEVNPMTRFEVNITTDRSLAQLFNKDYRISEIKIGLRDAGKKDTGLVILRRGKPLIRLKRLRVFRGGTVSLDHYQPLMPFDRMLKDEAAEELSGYVDADTVDAGVNVFSGADRVFGSGRTIAAFVDQEIRAKVNSAMTDALADLFFKHKAAVAMMLGKLTEQQMMNILGMKRPKSQRPANEHHIDR